MSRTAALLPEHLVVSETVMNGNASAMSPDRGGYSVGTLTTPVMDNGSSGGSSDNNNNNNFGFGVAGSGGKQVKYGYRSKLGPQHWCELSDDWKVSKYGVQQSPVDLASQYVVHDVTLPEIVYSYRFDPHAEFVNDGLLPKCNFAPGTHFISGGPAGHEYELAQFHFHFSGLGQNGSEHAIDGKRYPAEVHFVHFKVEYGSLENALKHEDGLAVVGALLDIGKALDIEHAFFDDDIKKFAHVQSVGETFGCAVDPSKYPLGSKKEYFTYAGSLTSPPCCECVRWIILSEPIMISKEAHHCLTDLRSLEGGLISNPGNFRPLQPLNGREIRRSYCSSPKVCCLPKGSGQSSHAQPQGVNKDAPPATPT